MMSLRGIEKTKKIKSLLMSALILASMLTLVLNIQPVKASETVYIRPDGSVDPPSAPISSVDNVTYTLNDDINESIGVERDNIVLDGAGYTVQGTFGGTGIDLSGRSNVTVKNTTVTGFEYGIYLHYSSNNTVSANTANNNLEYGICLYDSDGNTVSGNNANSNRKGIFLRESYRNTVSGNNANNNGYAGIQLYGSSNNTVSGSNANNNHYVGIMLFRSGNCTVSANTANNNTRYGLHFSQSSNNTVSANNANNNLEYGMHLWHSSNHTLSGNTMSGNRYNFVVRGETSSEFDNVVDLSNLADGRPVYYVRGVSDAVYDSTTNAATIHLIDSTNVTVRDLTLTNNYYGTFLWNTTNSRIENVTANNNRLGIRLRSSSNSTVSANNANNNTNEGIYLSSSNNNTISANTANNNYWGIDIVDSSNSTVSANNANNNEHGIYISYSNNNTVSGNNANNNARYGIYLCDSNNSTVSANNANKNNWYGIFLEYSDNNSIYHNNFDNTNQVYNFKSINTWDDGYPSGGNYWSDYAGIDLYSGPYQNETGSDGIGDTPYEIDEYNRDNYPLMNPWTPTPPSPVIAAIVDIDPDTLNLKSKGKWITCYISLPTGYNVTDINVDTILLNETIPAERSDIQDNVLMVKFKRANVSDFIIESLGKTYGDVTLTVTGELTDGTPFEDSYTFRVICPVNHPANLDKVRVVDCNGNPRNEVEKGRQVFIEAALNNTAPVPENITVTFEVIDCSGVPIDWAVVQRSFSTNLTVLILMLTIPEWASTGTATVYINAYTDPPWANGTPYCPETSTTITLQQA